MDVELEISELELASLWLGGCSICPAPAELREGNEKAFTPRLISFGPIHCSTGVSIPIKIKERIFWDFIKRTEETEEGFNDRVRRRIVSKKQLLERCYPYPYSPLVSRVDFIENMMVDAGIIVELLSSHASINNEQTSNPHFPDKVKLRSIRSDMLLLENQVPFFVIESFLSPTTKDDAVRPLAIKLIYEFFQESMNLLDIKESQVVQKLQGCEIEHFVDFARKCHLPLKMPSKGKLESLTIPTATQLFQAGVKLEMKKGSPLFDIEFKDGVLKIPCLRIYEATSNFLMNLIAYERSHLRDYFVNDYVFILDRLIDTPGDVELLIANGIFESELSNSSEVASVINKLSQVIILERKEFYFSGLCKQLNDYYGVPWHNWRATLKRDYFSNPWAIISVIAAIVLLVLTFVQTYYSVLSYYHR